MAEFSSELTCEEIERREAKGEIQRMSTSSREGLPEKDFDLTPYTDATTWLELCTSCRRDDSMRAVYGNLLMVFAAGFLFFDGLYQYRKKTYDRYRFNK
ncbi:MAG: hypothetical protein JXA21_22555 [Anaerolineae bacterium]|nr:hypothetical protein [Anaerolineae bacterium]